MNLHSVNPKQNLVELEQKLLKFWYSSEIVAKYLQKNKNSKKHFSFLDGPITANNPMGVHHAWGRTYKDLWQRFHNMMGAAQRFQNGFDEQGLWVEVEVEKELGLKSKKDIENLVPGDKFASIAKFVEACKQRVKKYSAIQTEQSKRLGYFMDWDYSYHTSSEENNYAIWNFLKVSHQKGYIYKGRDSVPWCPRCGTAISQHEILTEEYQDITHKAVYVKYKIRTKSKDQREKREYLLVWTTTPWTLPSNVAIAVNPELEYSLVGVNHELLWLASNLKSKIIPNSKEVKKIKGAKLTGLNYHGPFDDLPALKGVEHKVIGAKDLVTTDEGTGLVHIAPGAGDVDFDLAQKENLPVIASIDESANYIQGFGKLTAKNAKVNPDLVIDEIRQKGVLFKVENYTHRYPVCWRCKTELVWRLVDEWYIAMDKKDPDDAKGRTLRQQMIEVAKDIHWIPKWGLSRELDWLKNMGDWLISKKRYWGLALPFWECQRCQKFDVIGGKSELKKRASLGWEKFAGHSPHRPWIDEVKIKCANCGEISSRISDVGNPWLDAGIVPFSTMPTNWFPADFITESFPGQFKNWFYSLIAMSTVLKGSTPFKTVLGFATLLDERGEPMHKSKGNMIEFAEAAEQIGVDVMRWMYLTQNPEENLLFGYKKAQEIRRGFHLILWNVYNFFVIYAISDKWKPVKSKIDIKSADAKMNILDRWIISKLNQLISLVTKSLEKYDPVTASRTIENFIVNNLSTWYVRRSRERIGPTVSESEDKEQAYQTLYQVLVSLAKLLAPFTPFISDEIYQNLTGETSVHLSDWLKPNLKSINGQLENEMEIVRKLAEAGHGKRKAAGIKVRQPLAGITYFLPYKLTKEAEKVLTDELNVKTANFKKGQLKVKLVTKLTKALKSEGQARELVRKIQDERKKLSCELSEFVEVVLPDWPPEFTDYIMRQTLTTKIIKGFEFKVRRLNVNS